MTPERWFKSIVPIGALFSASLIFSNLAYLTLSVSFIQMCVHFASVIYKALNDILFRLKAFTSVAVLCMSVVFGLEQFSKRTLVIVLAISAGVALASVGEIAL